MNYPNTNVAECPAHPIAEGWMPAEVIFVKGKYVQTYSRPIPDHRTPEQKASDRAYFASPEFNALVNWRELETRTGGPSPKPKSFPIGSGLD